jgi:glutamate/tyrosine decarboxylase-like PLP-dependent enzyme
MYSKNLIILKHCSLAKTFATLVEADERMEVLGEVTLGLVCFRLKQSNEVNERLLKSINDEGKIYMVPSKINDTYFLRFAVCAVSTEREHIEFAWNVIVKNVEKILI